MITLYQYPAQWGLPCASPFCVKAETYLRMTGIDYEDKRIRDPRRSPTGKLPFIRDGETVIADSSLIIDHLRGRPGGDLDEGLTPEQRATSLAFRRMVEEHLYWFGVHIRWVIEENWQTTCQDTFGRMPLPFRLFVPNIVRKKVVQQIVGHGMGRLGHAEIEHMALDDFKALSVWLGDKPYFMGDEPREIDATTFAFLLSMLKQPHHNPIKPELDSLPNLAPYVERMRARYFPELAAA